ncbi:MAG: hypothetical protein HOK28_15135, partial [Deltaproteobacteria bacterium]|nr:hypothetical protein [Deltaproteobacteria bacterium]
MRLWFYKIGVVLFVVALATSVQAADADNDTLDDSWELTYFGSTLLYGPSDDPDDDGLDNSAEQSLATAPNNADSDADGLTDGLEVTAELDPLNPDVDGDGLCDGPGSTAICVAGEDLNADGVINPGESDPNRRDSDGGLSSDYVEVIVDGTDPLNGEDDLYDSDGDGIPDRLEWVGTFTDSFLPDSDFDGLCDGPGTVEGQCVAGEDTNGNGFQDPGESDPSHFDSDLDGLCDGPGTSFIALDCVGDESALGTDLLVVDSDNDGLSDLSEYGLTHDVDGNIVATCPSPLDPDCDWDGLLDGIEIVETASGFVERSDPCLQDTNGDGILDFSFYYDTREAVLDTDGDGLSDFFENTFGLDFGQVQILLNDIADPLIRAQMQERYETHLPAQHLAWVHYPGTFMNPLLADTDGDGLSDSEELFGTNIGDSAQYYRSNPADMDTDDDGVPDADEYVGSWSHPLLVDTDNDGLSDALEKGYTNEAVAELNADLPPGVAGTLNYQELVLDSDSSTTSDSNEPDTDSDGLLDGVEDANANGLVDLGETDPNLADTDGDGIRDDWEWTYFNLCAQGLGPQPTVADADFDGDEDGLGNITESSGGTSPCDFDSDDDGLCDGALTIGDCAGNEQSAGTGAADFDSDDDGIGDGVEFLSECLNPLNADVDGDGLSDGVEDQNLDGNVEAGVETDPCLSDTDGDGLGDGVELGQRSQACEENTAALLTNPLLADTDGDGLCDGPGVGDGICIGSEDANGDGCLAPSETSGRDADTDRDGLCDGPIVVTDGLSCSGGEDLDGNGSVEPNETDPLNRDTDGDHLLDGCPESMAMSLCEDQNNNGVVDELETDPRLSDTDGGGIGDDEEVLRLDTDPRDRCDDLLDADGDTIDDRIEELLGYDLNSADSDGDTISDVDESLSISDAFGCASYDSTDTDGDGVVDALDTDSDDDGLLDSIEAGDADLETPPVNTDATFSGDRADEVADFRDLDSDGGGFGDKLETEQGTNPLDPLDDGRGEIELGAEIRGGGCAAISSPSLLGLLFLLGWIRRRN